MPRRARYVRLRAPLGLAAAGCALLVAGCGSGSRQDAGESAGTFAMQVLRARFPTAQSIARQASFVLPVRNARR